MDAVAGGEDPGGAVAHGLDGRLAVQAVEAGSEGLLGEEQEDGEGRGREERREVEADTGTECGRSLD